MGNELPGEMTLGCVGAMGDHLEGGSERKDDETLIPETNDSPGLDEGLCQGPNRTVPE
jgi:hypothetical protein